VGYNSVADDTGLSSFV